MVDSRQAFSSNRAEFLSILFPNFQLSKKIPALFQVHMDQLNEWMALHLFPKSHSVYSTRNVAFVQLKTAHKHNEKEFVGNKKLRLQGFSM